MTNGTHPFEKLGYAYTPLKTTTPSSICIEKGVAQKKTQKGQRLSLCLFGKFAEFLVELVNTACRIHKLHFTRKERVAVRRNLHLDQWVFLAVFPLNGLFRVGAGATQKRIVSRNILEDHCAITLRMNIVFHN